MSVCWIADPSFMTAFGKLEGLAGRLILLTHIIESPFSPTVNADVVRRMVSMIRGYVIPHTDTRWVK